PLSPHLRALIRREVGQYWSSVPPAISNDRTGTTLSSFIAASDSLRAGCYWLEMARNLPAMIRRVGARRLGLLLFNRWLAASTAPRSCPSSGPGSLPGQSGPPPSRRGLPDGVPS